MNSSTRLYERLGQIPQDPEDPESLDDLVVCAFGAFERYYVCWKNKAGEYRQDGYDLQPALRDWLWPTDGTERDYASLQVVFGRGDEYFASDKNGKLEYKEPEVKPLPSSEDLEEKPVLRRARTSVSFFRPPPVTTKSAMPTPIESPSPSRRSSAASQQSSSRPPSMSFSSRTMSETSLSSLSFGRPPSDASLASQATSYSTTTTIPSRPTSDSDIKTSDTLEDPDQLSSPVAVSTRARSTSKLRPLSMSTKAGLIPRISEGTTLQLSSTATRTASPSAPVLPLATPPIQTPTTSSPHRPTLSLQTPTMHQTPSHCTCRFHPQPALRLTYADASVQTSPLPSPPHTALRLDTTISHDFHPSLSQSSASSVHTNEIQTPQDHQQYDYYEDGNMGGGGPFYMGRMMSYFSKPGYQLGDSLMNSYAYGGGQEAVVVEDDGGWAAWEAANGRGW